MHRTSVRRATWLAIAALLTGCTQTTAGGGASATAAATSGSTPAPAASLLRPVDRNALASLVASGGRRTCGHDIENEIAVPTVADGDAIASELPTPTYFVRVAQKAEGNGALVIVEEHVVPTDAAIVSMVAAMTRIARAHHGTFDRWETTPVKSC